MEKCGGRVRVAQILLPGLSLETNASVPEFEKMMVSSETNFFVVSLIEDNE